MNDRQPQLSSDALFDSASTLNSTSRYWYRPVESLFVGDISALRLAVISAVPVLVGVWLLLAPTQMLSREMTWDLMFNLSGAWSLHTGQIAHVDYHDLLGSLSYRFTQLGFLIAGPSPRALLIGEAFFLVPAFVAAVFAASRRLAPIPAAIFVIYVALLVVMPTNLGDEINAYSFAMWYNRWGWSLLTTLCLVLFLAPRLDRWPSWLDVAMCGVLLIILFYLKITFAVAGVAAIALALVASRHIRAQWRMWLIMLAVLLANAVAPYNSAYLSDIWHGITAGYAKSVVQEHLRIFFSNKAEYALYGIGVLMLLWLWARNQAPFRSIVLACGALGIGMLVFSQNAQPGDIPLGIVIAYLIYNALRDGQREIQTDRTVASLVPMMAVLIWPVISLVAIMMTMGGYYRAAQRDVNLVKVEATNLRGLAVPVDEGVGDALAKINLPYTLLSSPRERPLIDPLSQHEYVRTLLEAAELFADGRRGQAKIMVIDQVNVMPFVLGYPPPRGATLWVRREARPRPASAVFGDVDVVLIPKFATTAQITTFTLTTYHDYLETHFPVQEQSPSWTILSRERTAAASGDTP